MSSHMLWIICCFGTRMMERNSSRLLVCLFACWLISLFLFHFFIALCGSLQMRQSCRCTSVREFTSISIFSEICKEDVLFLARIRILRSTLDSNNQIWIVFDPNRVQIHNGPTCVVNLFCYGFVGIVLSICCDEYVCACACAFDVVRKRARETSRVIVCLHSHRHTISTQTDCESYELK